MPLGEGMHDLPEGMTPPGPARLMTQVAPYPEILAGLVETMGYREHLGWRVWLEDDCQRDKPGRHSGESRGLTLIVQRHGPDTYHPVNVENCAAALLYAMRRGSAELVQQKTALLEGALAGLITVNHYFPVPPATFTEASWKRWLFDTLGKVDDHERMEDFTIGGERPFAPVHKPGADPYIVVQVASREDVDTDFRGSRVHPDLPGSGLGSRLADRAVPGGPVAVAPDHRRRGNPVAALLAVPALVGTAPPRVIHWGQGWPAFRGGARRALPVPAAQDRSSEISGWS